MKTTCWSGILGIVALGGILAAATAIAEDAQPTVLVPTAETEARQWRYTLEQPPGNWVQPDFDDSAWPQGPAGFGTKLTPNAIVGTEWKTAGIWLRTGFEYDGRPFLSAIIRIHYDENPTVYLNGKEVYKGGWFAITYESVDATAAVKKALRTGRNVLAVECHQTGLGQYIDVGLALSAKADAALLALPPLAPLFDLPMRDTSVCLANGVYYLTGTAGYPTWWETNEGIRVWKSTDLKTWEPLGLVWTFEKDGTWQKAMCEGSRRALWAPEIFYLKETFWLAYSVNCVGTGLLKSTTGMPQGPYVDIKPDGPLTNTIDASLFQDDDGKVYFVFQNGQIARMKDDMSGFAEEPRLLKPANADQVGFEGAFLTKINGRYHLACAEFDQQRHYHCMAASADSLYGPYGDRYLAIPHGGHNMFFKDIGGQWWSTFFGNDPTAPFRERPGILRIEFDPNGRIRPLSS